MKNVVWFFVALLIIGSVFYFTMNWERSPFIEKEVPKEKISAPQVQEVLGRGGAKALTRSVGVDLDHEVLAASGDADLHLYQQMAAAHTGTQTLGDDGSADLYLYQRQAGLPLTSRLSQRFASLLLNPALEAALITGNLSLREQKELVSLVEEAAQEKEEEMALLIGLALIQQERYAEYKKMSEAWADSSLYREYWQILEANFLAAQAEKGEAIRRLEASAFPDGKDSARLMSLAMLYANEDSEKALSLLEESKRKEGTNPNLAIIKAKVFEKTNRFSEAAQELSAALEENTPPRREAIEALADLFNKCGYPSFAITLWDLAPEQLSFDKTAESLFWKHVVSSGRLMESKSTDPYLHYLATLPSGKFWDAQSFQSISGNASLEGTQQEIYWLRLLDSLASGEKKRALELLQENKFKGFSWDQELEFALEAVLQQQLHGHLAFTRPSKDGAEAKDAAAPSSHEPIPFIDDLLTAAEKKTVLSQEQLAWLKDANVFSAMLMAKGWEKAALALYRPEGGPKAFPEWYGVAMVKAMGKERGVEEALIFALRQEHSQEIDIQIAQLYLGNGKVAEALSLLETLRNQPDDIGARAAWIAAQQHWRDGRLEMAQEIILSNQVLADTPTGQEALKVMAAKRNME